MNEPNPIQGLGPPGIPGLDSKSVKPDKTQSTAFDDMLKGFMKDVNQMQNTADESIQKMVAGEVKDVHQVMLAVEEAKVAFNMMLEIRNKTMEAYNELIRMRG